jgi:hypothetical protein
MIESIDNILDNFAVAVVERAQRNLGATRTVNGKKRRAVSSGNLKNSLSFVRSETNNFQFVNFTATGTARQYANMVEYGRRKGATPPPIDPIMKWIKTKPVRLQKKGGGFVKMTPQAIRSAAFAISKSIGKNGIPAVMYYNNAVQEELADRGPQFLEALQKELTTRFNLGK